ncbi:MAG: hypothetical protein CM1200mP30_21310 [Pseudomonadota bacterium]|nr:MAG: hypothetical protein CM1200mP30_21310 [Pseudomonadota bacterium]
MIGGYPVEPVDLHPSIRHLDVLSTSLLFLIRLLMLTHLERSV